MKPEPWKKAEKLYHATLEREPSERDAFLEKACGGDATSISCRRARGWRSR